MPRRSMLRIALGPDLELSALRAVLERPVVVVLQPKVIARVRRAARAVERIVASGETVYGVNTGFGSLAQTRIAARSARAPAEKSGALARRGHRAAAVGCGRTPAAGAQARELGPGLLGRAGADHACARAPARNRDLSLHSRPRVRSGPRGTSRRSHTWRPPCSASVRCASPVAACRRSRRSRASASSRCVSGPRRASRCSMVRRSPPRWHWRRCARSRTCSRRH